MSDESSASSSEVASGPKLELKGPNRAAVLMKQGELVIKDIPMPTAPKPKQVVIQMKAVGICGSDVHYWVHGRIGDFVVKKPMVIGHECAGQVVAVGSAVTHLKVGDRVAIEPGVPCGFCQHCKGGRYNLCPDIEFFATPPYDGSLCTYVTHAADFCFKLPDNVSYEEGALCEPLSVGVYGCQRAQVKPGSRVAILGSGPIGLVMMMVARAFGAEFVLVTDVSADRVAAAKKFGADAVLNTRGKTAREVSDAIIKAAGGQVDIVFECCGMEVATQTAIYSTKNGGTAVLIGLHDPEMKLPIFDASVREVDLRGVFRYNNTYPTCISLISTGRVNAKPMITHRLPFDKMLRGFEIAKSGEDNAIKVMFNL